MFYLFLDHTPAVQGTSHRAIGFGADHAELALYTGVVLNEDLLLLGINLVDDGGEIVTAPQANVWYFVDVAWCLEAGVSPAASHTALGGDGTFDRVYSGPGVPHTVSTGGRFSIDLGFSPDGDAVYLGITDAAVAFWRVLFPAPGSYTLTLEGMGEVTYVVGEAPVFTVPFITVLKMNPLNRESSILVQMDFDGEYPSGGLDLPDGSLGRPSYFFGDVNADPPYQFSYHPDDPFKLHVYTASGEVGAGASITFSTTALFIGP